MMGDLPEWKRERGVSFLWVTYPERRKKYGLVVMGDLPKEKYGLIVMGDLPKEKGRWSHSLGDLPRGRNGLILMGDLPR